MSTRTIKGSVIVLAFAAFTIGGVMLLKSNWEKEMRIRELTEFSDNLVRSLKSEEEAGAEMPISFHAFPSRIKSVRISGFKGKLQWFDRLPADQGDVANFHGSLSPHATSGVNDETKLTVPPGAKGLLLRGTALKDTYSIDYLD